jgi:protein-S-isoprenylcysteine O-methyltransferase Ste14
VSPLRRRLLALAWAVLCHGSFAVAVSAMALGLGCGMRLGIGRLDGLERWIANGLLCVQFPLAHSWLLTRRGRRLLARAAPGAAGATLVPTVFATLAAWQILATFVLWSPSDVLLFEAHGAARAAFLAAFGLSWVVLLKALSDAGLGLQTGSIGWRALWSGSAPRYPDMPERGLFAACRQPIYLGFALLLWTGPSWTLDHLVLGLAWSAYCFLGPRLKERRFAERYGARFAAYRSATGYFLPRLAPLLLRTRR